MKLELARRSLCSLKTLLLAVVLLLPMGGCPVDTDELVTDVTRAALESITTSLVDTLSTYLAGT